MTPTQEAIAARYAALMGLNMNEHHLALAQHIIDTNAYGLEYLANGLNPIGKAVFTEATGIKLPKQQAATWKALRTWAGVSDEADTKEKAWRKVIAERNALKGRIDDGAFEAIEEKIAAGFRRLERAGKSGRQTWLLNEGGMGFNLSQRGSGRSALVPYLKARLAYEEARDALNEAETRRNLAGPQTDDCPMTKTRHSTIPVTRSRNHACVAHIVAEPGAGLRLLRVTPDKGEAPELGDLAGAVFQSRGEIRAAVRDRMKPASDESPPELEITAG